MKNLEELIEHHTHCITDDKHNKWEVIEVSDLKDIITQAVHQALDEAAEGARIKFHDGHFKTDKLLQHIQIGANNATIDKDSILKLKEKY